MMPGGRVECCICRRGCVPLADYDAPTCIDCADAMDAITIRAQMAEFVRELAHPPVVAA